MCNCQSKININILTCTIHLLSLPTSPLIYFGIFLAESKLTGIIKGGGSLNESRTRGGAVGGVTDCFGCFCLFF